MNYEIIKTKDPNIIEFLIPHFESFFIKSKANYSFDTFIKWYRMNIANPYVYTFVAIKKGNKLYKDDSNIIGYCIATLNVSMAGEQLNILHLYSNEKKITKNLVSEVENFARKNKIHYLTGATSRNPKAMLRIFKDGWKINSYNMIKEVNNG